MPLGVAEPARKPADALLIYDPVGDEPHGSPHDVRAHVPLGRPRRGIGPTTLAGAGPTRLGRRGRVEAHVGVIVPNCHGVVRAVMVRATVEGTSRRSNA